MAQHFHTNSATSESTRFSGGASVLPPLEKISVYSPAWSRADPALNEKCHTNDSTSLTDPSPDSATMLCNTTVLQSMPIDDSNPDLDANPDSATMLCNTTVLQSMPIDDSNPDLDVNPDTATMLCMWLYKGVGSQVGSPPVVQCWNSCYMHSCPFRLWWFSNERVGPD